MVQQVINLNGNTEAFFVEQRTTTLSLAVSLSDDFASGDDFASRKRPIGKVNVSLEELRMSGIQNLSGYYFFMDVPPNTIDRPFYTLSVTSDYYVDLQSQGTLPRPDPSVPVSITLTPVPTYPFPPGATLIKGVVTDLQQQPISGASVTVVSTGMVSQTTEKGEFVAYFTRLTEDDIIIVNNRRFVRGNGTQTMVLQATHPNFSDIQVQTEVEENQTTYVPITMQP